ncbi:MAG: type II secretion system minor pseudopilin GspH [Woeseiaceae bacterium]|nr:type II secretion system minor pseudopilin GspH [Woeseiaceae bacterium]
MPISVTGISRTDFTGRPRSRGFTLIEILVAVVIVGIVMSVAVLSLTLVADDREIRNEARRLMSLIEVAQNDAMMQGREFGVEFMLGGYRFVEYDALAAAWAPPPGDDALRLWTLPEDYELQLFIDDTRVPLDVEPKKLDADAPGPADRTPYLPHVFLFSSGEVTPFELQLTRLLDSRSVAIEGDLLGNLDFVTDDDQRPL